MCHEDKDMKKVWAALLLTALALPLPGQAKEGYAIAEIRNQAARGWTQTYRAHGREIRVNVMPRIPEADKVPVSRCQSLSFPFTIPQDDPLWHSLRQEQPGDLFIQRSAPGEEPAGGLTVKGKRVSAKPWKVLYEGFSKEGAYIAGNPVTFGELSGWTGETLRTLGVDPAVIRADQPQEIRSHAFYGANEGEFLAPGWASFHWPQVIDGLPLLCGHPFSRVESGRAGTGVSLCYQSPDNFWIGVHLLTPVEKLAEDIPLAGFSRVVAALEEEIAAGRLRQVLQMRLGYALFEAPGYTARQVRDWERTFYLFPVWIVDAVHADSARAEAKPVYVEEEDPYFYDPHNSLSFAVLLINAQSGEMINRETRKAGEVSLPRFFRWEDSGKK